MVFNLPLKIRTATRKPYDTRTPVYLYHILRHHRQEATKIKPKIQLEKYSDKKNNKTNTEIWKKADQLIFHQWHDSVDLQNLNQGVFPKWICVQTK